MISMIAALGISGGTYCVIGKDGKLPWGNPIPADMEWFKKITKGQAVVMGRKTWDSLPARYKPLPGRLNIVLTRSPLFDESGAIVAQSVDDVLAMAGMREIIVIGGGELYQQFFHHAKRLYVTLVKKEFGGDTYFPRIDKKRWRIVHAEKVKQGEKSPYDLAFVIYEERKKFYLGGAPRASFCLIYWSAP